MELKGDADVLKKDDPTIMATPRLHQDNRVWIKEVADRLMIPLSTTTTCCWGG
jgi:hypothetical protein